MSAVKHPVYHLLTPCISAIKNILYITIKLPLAQSTWSSWKVSSSPHNLAVAHWREELVHLEFFLKASNLENISSKTKNLERYSEKLKTWKISLTTKKLSKYSEEKKQKKHGEIIQKAKKNLSQHSEKLKPGRKN